MVSDAEPVEERLARRLDPPGEGGAARRGASRLLHGLGHYDGAVYEMVAGWQTPWADAPLRSVSRFANHSKPWLALAAVLALRGGPPGRRAAVAGVCAIGATSLLVNQPLKALSRRRRPDRPVLGVPEDRWVTMPTSRSFPSGHAASAAAFAVTVGHLLPTLRRPLRAAAVVVGFSRVYTGVHYPSDVLVGATVGALVGRVTGRLADRVPVG